VRTVNTQTEDVKLDGDFDWVHIDAGHETDDAIHDILTFWPATARVMTVHDYTGHQPVKAAVDRVVAEHMIDFRFHNLVASSGGFYCFAR
jgi:hypothetical protein